MTVQQKLQKFLRLVRGTNFIYDSSGSFFHYILIVAVRHGQKDVSALKDDALTKHGLVQARAQALNLQELGIKPDHLVFNGMNITRQTADTFAEIFSLDINPVEDRLFNSDTVRDILHPDNPQAVLDELVWVKNNGGTVTTALHNAQSGYAAIIRAQIQVALTNTARNMKGKNFKIAVVFVNSPCLELPTLHPDTTPYGIPECAAVAYLMREQTCIHNDEFSHYVWQIMDSLYIQPAFQDETN